MSLEEDAIANANAVANARPQRCLLSTRTSDMCIFQGKMHEEDVDLWIENLEYFAEFNNWTSKDIMKAIPLYLDGDARVWYTCLDPSVKKGDWSLLKRKLQDRYRPRGYIEDLESTLENLKQGAMSVMEYDLRLRRLLSKLPLVPPIKQCEIFLRGLADSIRSYVSNRKPTSLDEAFHLAQEKECELVNIGKYLNMSPVATETVIKTPDHSKIKHKTESFDVDSLTSALEKLAVFMVEKAKQRSNTLICFNCKEEGHVSRNCPKAKIKESRLSEPILDETWNKETVQEGMDMILEALMAKRKLEESDNIINEPPKRIVKGKDVNKTHSSSIKATTHEKKNYAAPDKSMDIMEGSYKKLIEQENVKSALKKRNIIQFEYNAINKAASPYSLIEDLKIQKPNINMLQLIQKSPEIRRELARGLIVPRKKNNSSTLNDNKIEVISEARKLELDKYDSMAPRIDAVINGFPLEVVIDGGSAVNIVSKELVEKLGLQWKKQKTKILVADDNLAHSEGICDSLVLEIGDLKIPLAAVMLNISKYSLLLGRPWLKEVSSVTDWKKDTFWFTYGGQRISVQNKTSRNSGYQDAENAFYEEVYESENDNFKNTEFNKYLLNECEMDFDPSEEALPEDVVNELLELDNQESLENFLVELSDEGAICSPPESECLPVDFRLLSNNDENLFSLLQNWTCLFNRDGLCIPTKVVSHKIETGDATPIIRPAYRVSPMMADIQKAQIEDMLKRGIVRRSDAPWRSALVMIPKKDGSYRMCVDYRPLNAVTKTNALVLPRVDDCLETVSGHSYYSTLDLFSGFWQVPMYEPDIEKTTFTTCHFGSYSFNVMPFGLKNAPATFHNLMNMTLFKYINDFVMVYLDDVIIFSKSYEGHLEHLKQVFSALNDAKLQLNFQKCHLLQRKVKFLGHIVSGSGIETDPEKVSAVKEFPIPTCVTDLKSFLGTCSYYRKFIPNFSLIAHSLNKLLKKNTPFVWGEEQESSFVLLKNCLINSPVLVPPDYSKEFILSTDASVNGLGAMLSQLDDDGNERAVIYLSRSTNVHEKNYSTCELECLAVVYALKKLRHYLLGKKFILITDHQALIGLMNKSELKGKFARWVIELSEFVFDIRYRAGKANKVADALSRYPKSDNIKECNLLENRSLVQKFIKVKEYLSNLKVNDDNVTDENYSRRFKKYAMKFCVVDGKLYLRKNDGTLAEVVLDFNQRFSLVREMHEGRAHFGVRATFDSLRMSYYWPEMYTDVKEFIKSCLNCQRFAPAKNLNVTTSRIPTSYLFERISLDFVGPLELSKKGYRYILVATEYLSRWPIARATKAATAEVVADFIYEDIICQYGCPSIILTDRGTHFENALVKSLCEKMLIKHSTTTPYNPKCNGMVERFNRTLCRGIAKMVLQTRSDWDENIHSVLLAYRLKIHAETGFTPFFILYGKEARMSATNLEKLSIFTQVHADEEEMLDLRLEELENSYTARLRVVDEQQAAALNIVNPLKPGDLVFLFRSSIVAGKSSKFKHLWGGPFIVDKKIYENVYTLKTLSGTSLSNYFSGSKLKKVFIRPPVPNSRGGTCYDLDGLAQEPRKGTGKSRNTTGSDLRDSRSLPESC